MAANWRELFTTKELTENYLKIENGIDPNEEELESETEGVDSDS